MAKLYFYYASMNAGKSTTLLQADFNYRERGMTYDIVHCGDRRPLAKRGRSPRASSLPPTQSRSIATTDLVAIIHRAGEARPARVCWSMRRSS
jgi:thymidine kinase